MNKEINLEKREKIKKVVYGTLFLLSLGFFSKFEYIENKISPKKENYDVKYNEKGFIQEINNNGKVFKFENGRLL